MDTGIATGGGATAGATVDATSIAVMDLASICTWVRDGVVGVIVIAIGNRSAARASFASAAHSDHESALRAEPSI